MGNQIVNGRNHKKNIIKLSLNSISTNSVIQDNLSLCNNKEKDIKKFVIDKEKCIPNTLYENDNKSINQTELNKKARINSNNNKIICLSSYSMKIDKSKKIENSNFSTKIYIDNIKQNNYNRAKNYNEFNSNDNRIKNNRIYQNSFNEKNKLSYDNLHNKLNKEKDKNIMGKNKLLDLNEVNTIYYSSEDKDNKSSLNSSKFINFDIINEKVTLTDRLELTNQSNCNNNKLYQINKNERNKNKDPKKRNYFEIEFEDYIKKLNLEEFNLDKELIERPLFFEVKKKYKKNKSKKVFKKNNIDKNYKFLSINRNKKIKSTLFDSNIFTNSFLMNKLNNITILSKSYQNKKCESKRIPHKVIKIMNSNSNNNIKEYNNKLSNKNQNIKANFPYQKKLSRELYLNLKKEKSAFPNSNSNQLISNFLYDISISKEFNSFNESKNSKKNDSIHKDYFNFKRLIHQNYYNLNISDSLLSSKIKRNINFNNIKSMSTSRIESLSSKDKNLCKYGKNGVFGKYLKSSCQSVHTSQKKYIYKIGFSRGKKINLSSHNISDEKIKKKKYKIIHIFKNKIFNHSVLSKSNENKINRIKNNNIKKNNYFRSNDNNFIFKRNSSRNNLFEYNSDYKFDNSKKMNNIEINLLLNSKTPSFGQRKISPIIKNKNFNNISNNYKNKISNNNKKIFQLKRKSFNFIAKNLNENQNKFKKSFK